MSMQNSEISKKNKLNGVDQMNYMSSFLFFIVYQQKFVYEINSIMMQMKRLICLLAILTELLR